MRAIARYRGDCAAVPSFALGLCVRRVTAEVAATLDLASLRLLFDGAEPIDAAAIDAFVERFGPSGVRREVVFPCYGLAEGTLIATGPPDDAPPRVRSFDAAALRRGQATDAVESAVAVRHVSCGRPIPDSSLLVVDPATRVVCPAGLVGEIWLEGPSVAGGYWRDEAATNAAFGASTSDGRGAFLRTGDLGAVVDGDLYVIDRLKDLIIVAGKNHASADVERTALTAHPRLHPGGVAAVSATDADGRECLALVLEVDPPHAASDGEAIVAAAAPDRPAP